MIRFEPSRSVCEKRGARLVLRAQFRSVRAVTQKEALARATHNQIQRFFLPRVLF